MNYETASDHEINKAVADALLIAWHCRPRLSASGTWEFSDNYERYGKGGKAVDLQDYCNDPAAAWPVIDDNRISLINEFDEWTALYNVSVGCGGNISCTEEYTDYYPLRAAMIVFLMMQDSATQ